MKEQFVVTDRYKILQDTGNFRQILSTPTHKHINLLAPDFFFLILAHPVYKLWIKQEPNALELWNILRFEEEKKNG